MGVLAHVYWRRQVDASFYLCYYLFVSMLTLYMEYFMATTRKLTAKERSMVVLAFEAKIAMLKRATAAETDLDVKSLREKSHADYVGLQAAFSSGSLDLE